MVKEWTPVKERLPEKAGEYRAEIDGFVFQSYFDPDDEGYITFWRKNVTAWAEVPEGCKKFFTDADKPR